MKKCKLGPINVQPSSRKKIDLASDLQLHVCANDTVYSTAQWKKFTSKILNRSIDKKERKMRKVTKNKHVIQPLLGSIPPSPHRESKK